MIEAIHLQLLLATFAGGLVRYYTFFIIDAASRRVQIAGTTTSPASVWMILLTAYQAPNINAHAEWFVRSIKSECLDQMIFLGREPLVHAIAEYTEHYHEERSHQGIGNKLISGTPPRSDGMVEVGERLGGLLKYYHRRVA